MIAVSRLAEGLGADAVMVTPAKEPVPSDDRIIEFYQRIAEGLSIPIVLQGHLASSEVHLPVELVARVLRAVPSIGCVTEEVVPTAPKIRLLREALAERPVPVLSGLGALYAPFDLEAGSDGFNTGFAFPEVLQALVKAALEDDWVLVHQIYWHFGALIVFEQQPGVAIRKELFCRRGLLASACARHPGATISAGQTRLFDGLLERTLPGVDITRAINVAEMLYASP